VAGFRAWLKLGYCGRKGETAIRIWVPIPASKAKLEAWRSAGADPAEKPRTLFRLGPVFHRSQVCELPPPAIPVTIDCPIAARIAGAGPPAMIRRPETLNYPGELPGSPRTMSAALPCRS
jgi:hypothetical protein